MNKKKGMKGSGTRKKKKGHLRTLGEEGLEMVRTDSLPPVLFIQKVSGFQVTSVTHLGSERKGKWI